MCTHICICIHTSIHTHIHTHTHTHTDTRTHTYTYTQAYTHTHRHTHTDTQTEKEQATQHLLTWAPVCLLGAGACLTKLYIFDSSIFGKFFTGARSVETIIAYFFESIKVSFGMDMSPNTFRSTPLGDPAKFVETFQKANVSTFSFLRK